MQGAKITELYLTDALDRVEADEAGPGEIVAIAGIAEVTIGETLSDPDDPRPLPAIIVDEPSLSMTVGVNTSPLSGAQGNKLTARQILARLESELVGNVSIRVLATERPDTWEVQGRGELQLAVLVETMRREGFEMTVGKPQVVTHEIDGVVHEPMERVAIDSPDDYLGVVTQLMALRKGTLLEIVNHGTGWVRMDYRVPARGLVGFRSEFLTDDARDRSTPSHLRRLGAVAWRATDETPRVDGRRPPRPHDRLFTDGSPGTRHAAGRAGQRGLRGDDHRRERPRRGDGREPDPGEEADEHPGGTGGRGDPAHTARRVLTGAGARVHRGGRVRRGDARRGQVAEVGARPSGQGTPGAARSARPEADSRRGPASTPELLLTTARTAGLCHQMASSPAAPWVSSMSLTWVSSSVLLPLR